MGITLSLEETIKKEVNDRSNCHLVMVDGMSKLMTRKVEKCMSSDIHIGGLKWNIIIFPEKDDRLSFALMISDSKCTGCNWKVNICCLKLTLYSNTSSLLNKRHHKLSGCFDANGDSVVAKSLVSFKELKEDFMMEDKAVFSAEITGVEVKFLDVTSVPRTMGTSERIKLMEVARNNSKFTWKITKFSSFDGEHHSSYQFTVGPQKWYLQMYPKGTLKGKGNSLSLYLHASGDVTNDPKIKTLAVYKLRVLDQLKLNHHEIGQEYWFSSNDQKGDPKFMALEKLHKASNGFLVNDEIYLGVEFLFVSTTENLW